MNHSSSEIAISPVPLRIQSKPGEETAAGLFSDLLVLTKVRLTSLVLITTFVGFFMASGDHVNLGLLASTLLGTALVAGASQALNQVVETDVDRIMNRTKDRPLPAGRIKRQNVFGVAMAMALIGMVYLALAVNLVSAYLAATTFFVYLALYTPLKRYSSICIKVGAIAGAIPPIIGWTAAHPRLEVGAWILFGILFLWQIPHFLSIAWMYRDEYAQAGLAMIRRNDIGGKLTAMESLLFTIGLVTLTFIPVYLEKAGAAYGIGAGICGLGILVCALRFFFEPTRPNASRLFLVSILYLPILLCLMAITKS